MTPEPVPANGISNSSNKISVHKLHNLISVIIAEAQLLRLDLPEDDPDYWSTVAIERAGRQLETLVDEMAEGKPVDQQNARLRETAARPTEEKITEAVES